MTRGSGSGENIHVISLTKSGALVGAKVAALLEATLYLPEKYSTDGVSTPFAGSIADLMKSLWPEATGFILIMAAGIAVRSIAPLLEDKYSDPAVVVIDPLGKFAVPLLSGHIGGANEIATEVGEALGMTAVLTTATDAQGRPAIEVWATKRGYYFDDRVGVLKVNSAWANGEKVCLYLDPLYDEELVSDLLPHLDLVTGDEAVARGYEGATVALSHRISDIPGALNIYLPSLVVGVGSRRAADPDKVERGVLSALLERGYSPHSVSVVASVDAKKGEAAIIDLAAKLGVRFITFTSEELNRFNAPNPSERVKEAVGTPSVSEASALAASGGGKLLMEKVGGDVWTLAVALKELEFHK